MQVRMAPEKEPLMWGWKYAFLKPNHPPQGVTSTCGHHGLAPYTPEHLTHLIPSSAHHTLQ